MQITTITTIVLAVVGVGNLAVLFAHYYQRRSLARPNLTFYDVRQGKEPVTDPPLRIVLMNTGERHALMKSASLRFGDKHQQAVALSPSVVAPKQFTIFEMRGAFRTTLQSYFAEKPTPNRGQLVVTFSELNGTWQRTETIDVPLFVPSAVTNDTTLAYWTGDLDSDRPSDWT